LFTRTRERELGNHPLFIIIIRIMF